MFQLHLFAAESSIDWRNADLAKAELTRQNVKEPDIGIIQGLIAHRPAEPGTMSSDAFEFMIRNSDLLRAITEKELVLEHIHVKDLVDLSNAEIKVPILMQHCRFEGGLKVRNISIVGLVMENCELASFEGDGAAIANDLVVGPRTTVASEFRLPNARVGGGITIRNGAKLLHGAARDCSLNLWDAEVNGQVHIGDDGDPAELVGTLILNGSTMGNLELENVVVRRPAGREDFAVLANSTTIRGSFGIASKTVVTGPLNFQGADIGGSVYVKGLEIRSFRNALNFETARIGASMTLLDLKVNLPEEDTAIQQGEPVEPAESGLRLTRMRLGGDLEVEASAIRASWISLNAEGMECAGRVLMKNNDVTGEVRFSSAQIKGDLIFQSGAYLAGSKSGGKVLGIDAAGIERALVLSENVDDANARGVRLQGLASFLGAHVGTDFRVRKAELQDARMDLRQAWANRFVFPKDSWPEELCLDGFGYKRVSFDDDDFKAPSGRDRRSIARDLTEDSVQLLKLATTNKKRFDPQPYEEMASVMREMGHEAVSREILIEMSSGRMKFADGNFGDRLWFGVFGRVIGYGYNPIKAFWISLGWVFFASFMFWWAFAKEAIVRAEPVPAGQGDPPGRGHLYFSFALPYAVERFVPFLSLGVAEQWTPREDFSKDKCLGTVSVRLFTMLHVVLGWILASLWVGALTGLAK